MRKENEEELGREEDGGRMKREEGTDLKEHQTNGHVNVCTSGGNDHINCDKQLCCNSWLNAGQ